jgi:hypothetical protein
MSFPQKAYLARSGPPFCTQAFSRTAPQGGGWRVFLRPARSWSDESIRNRGGVPVPPILLEPGGKI